MGRALQEVRQNLKKVANSYHDSPSGWKLAKPEPPAGQEPRTREERSMWIGNVMMGKEKLAAISACAVSLALCGALDAQAYLMVDGALMSPMGGGTTTSVRRPMEGCGPGQRQQLSSAEQEALQFRSLQIAGNDLKAAVNTVRTSLHWHNNLEQAVADAKNQSKPIVWIHALGELDGFL
jgi:hypothetical protein